jgi:hypothetical protein
MAVAETTKDTPPATPQPPAEFVPLSAWMQALGWMVKGAGFTLSPSETRDDQYARWKDQMENMERFRRRVRSDTSRENWDKHVSSGPFPAHTAKTAFNALGGAQYAVAIQSPAYAEGAGWRQDLCALGEIAKTPPEDTTPYVFRGPCLSITVTLQPDAAGSPAPAIAITERLAYTDSHRITAEKPEAPHISFTAAAAPVKTTTYAWAERLKAEDQIIQWIAAHNAPAPLPPQPAKPGKPAGEKPPEPKPAPAAPQQTAGPPLKPQ